MMFLGVLVHASHADFDLGEYEPIRFISESFRMACFFLISGYFSVHVLARMSQPSFILKRLVMLGVPAVVCVVLLVPPTAGWMRTYFVEGGALQGPRFGWMGHAWFLFVLLFYTLGTGQTLRLVNALVAIAQRYIPLAAVQLLLFLAAVVFAVATTKTIHKFGPGLPFYQAWGFLLHSTFEYLPFFVLGMMMRQWANIYHFFHARPLIWLVASALLLPLHYYLRQFEITGTLQHLWLLLIAYSTAVCISATLLSLSVRFLGGASTVVRILSESAYTVYIIHYVIIAWMLMELQRWGVGMTERMLAAFLLASILGVVVHVGLVKKSRLAAFLLNGRLHTKKPLPAV